MTEEPFSWRLQVIGRSMGLGALCGAGVGAALVLFLLFAGVGAPAFALAGVVGGALAGGAPGLAAGIALIACERIVCRSRVMASLVAGAGAGAIPLAVTLWLLANPRPHAYGLRSLAVSVAFFVGAAVLGPTAVGGKTGWRSRGGPPASPARPDDAA